MNRISRTVALVVLLITTGCRTVKLHPASLSATITEEGLLTCFPTGTAIDGKAVWCEASAVAYDGRNLLFANDKDVPAGISPVFTKTSATFTDSTQSPAYLMAPVYSSARKYEDFAQTPDRRFVLITTAFDRLKPGSTDWDGYNTILYWRNGDEQHPHVLAPDDTSRTSMAYRTKLAQVLATNEFPASIPYFKVEGLAITDRHLLFGIREAGASFSDFKPISKIIAVSYIIAKTGADERIQLRDDWRVVASFDPAAIEPALPKPLSLSSLEYDPYHNCFWLLTSLESKDRLDAYLWSISPTDLFANKPFTLVRDARQQPLHFGHKAEDLTPLTASQLLIIHDDDRFQLPVGTKIRQPNQTPYTILTLN